MMKNTPNTKTIGISCNDPIVIDSSDEELDASHEIVLQRAKVPRKKTSSKQEKAPSEKHVDPEQSQWLLEKKRKNFRGVRRKMGKYVSEIKDPVDKKRYWLGTFKTPEEASMAYLAKKAEFNEKVNKAKQKTVSEKLSENETSDLLGKNKVAGNEEKIGFLNGVQIVDNDGFFVGELSQLDDLSIGCTEDGVFIPDMNFKQK